MKKLITLIFTMMLAGIAITAAKPQKQPKGPPSNADFIERFDTDGDGKLDGAEREAARQAMEAEGRRPGGRQEQIRQRMLEKFDANGDGKLTGDERKKAKEAKREQMRLRRFDKDRDGKLNETELAEAEAFKAERKAKMLARFDTDGDGELSAEERKTARQTMRKEGKAKKASRGDKGNRNGPPPPPEA